MTRLPHTVKILLENIARRAGGRDVTDADVVALAQWPNGADVLPRVHAGTSADARLYGGSCGRGPCGIKKCDRRVRRDPKRVNPFIPVDLIIDHSVQVDRFGSARRLRRESGWEYRRNQERYALMNWAQQAFEGFRVVPPGMGICHQVNLEHLGRSWHRVTGGCFRIRW